MIITLRTLRRDHPALFHPNQDWFEDEPFMDEPIPPEGERPSVPPHRIIRRDFYGHEQDILLMTRPVTTAGILAAIYVTDPLNVLWADYLWTGNFDRFGQRVYVGGTANGRGFEIHRHLHLTERWGIPVW